MVTRFVGVDSVTPKLPAVVITATQGTTAADFAAGLHTHAKVDVGLGNVDNTADASKPISTATQTALDAKAPLRQTVSTSAATTYTLALTDEAKLLVFSAATAIALTVPTNATAAFAIGARIDLAQTGAGKITVAGAGGVTVTATPSLVLRAVGSVASLVKIGTDAWLLTGDLA